MLPTNFTNLLLALQYRKTYQKALSMGKEKFNIKQNNIEDLTPFKTLELYRTVVKKFYMSRIEITQGSWFQNQLRIYLWLLIGYLFVYKKTIQQMQTEDWSYFIPIFHNRPQISFQYQALSLISQSRSSKWSLSEIEMLTQIIKQKQNKNKWNEIARQLFIRSQKRFYRYPKQCRQRWLNYLDPNKKKSGWQKSEDLLLLKTILQFGNRWSTAVKMLNDTRTQHMVKNRFKSLIANEKKHGKQAQCEIIIRMIEKLQKDLGDDSKCLNQLSLGKKMNTNSSLHQSNTNENYVHSQFSHTNYHINSPFFNPHSINKISDPISQSHYSQNQFLMSNQQIQNFLLLDIQKQDQDKIHIRDQQRQNKGFQQQHEFFQKKQHINYFSEEYHVGFP